MPDYLCISIRFLGGSFHGRADYGEPEWPPSPLRLYQAIVAASAACENRRGNPPLESAALRWLEQLSPPFVAAPPAREMQGYRLYVPDNVGDIVANQWSAGRYFDNKNHPIDVTSYRTEKSVRPLAVPDEAAVHYVWPLANVPTGYAPHIDVLTSAVRSITHIGWGVDLVAADVSVLDENAVRDLKGERWLPGPNISRTRLRTPLVGTLDDLNRRHHAFLTRVTADGGLIPVPPLTVFGITGYCSESEVPQSPRAVFVLRKQDDSGFRAFDPVRRGLHVAGMFRHMTSQPHIVRSIGWSDADTRRIVLGHGETVGDEHKPVAGARIAFLPLPSIEMREAGERVVGSIRRVLMTTSGNLSPQEFRRLTHRLDGQELTDEKSQQVAAVIFRLDGKDAEKMEGAVRPYFDESATWATVTPVVLPGYDDPRKLRHRLNDSAAPLSSDEKAEILRKLEARIDHLLRKAILQSGFSEAMARDAELEWRSTGFWPGTAHASHYAVPEQHRRYRRLHVRITWRNPDGSPLTVSGPISLGGGRFSGLGLFAARKTDDSTF
jgi:CRISPR-associated protein Csb2